MDLQTILGRLRSVSGPNSSGEYTARCPVHDDKTASLTVRQKASQKDGKQRIYLHCHANCGQDEIMAALGITARDLIVDPDPARPAAKSQRKDRGAFRNTTAAPSSSATGGDGAAAPGPPSGETSQQSGKPSAGDTTVVPGAVVYQAAPEQPKAEKKDELVPDWDHPDRVYSYTDEEGRELFQVVRLHYKDGKPGKTFRQRVYDPQNPKANRSGFVNSVPSEVRDRTIYRMPRVIQAIADGKPVYVVEGEKDVETLERLGFCATCNPGGAGKWRGGYSRRLAGADVIILPDNDTKGNDYAGQNHAYDVALKLHGLAKRVRLVDIREACPDLPPKGDISDMVQIMGDTAAMDALARQVAATRDFEPDAVPFWLTPMEQAERLYGTVRGYGVTDGCISQVTGDGSKALCDFVVLPRMELTCDDGEKQTLNFVLDGWNAGGHKLGRVTIKAADLDGMGWVTEKWGFGASLAPGSTTKSKVAWAIKKVGQLTAKRVTEYNHTGWRKIGGKWAYLYHGGAVGMEGVTVNMGDALKGYRLDGGGAEGFDRIPFAEAAAESLKVKSVMREDMGIALLGTMYLAPLREFMSMTDVVPAFALFLYGETGTHKSTAAALALSHFGNYHAKNPPASFNDTGNQIRKKAFLVKDMPLLVDDFHPTTSIQEKRQMSATAQAISRAFGDGVDRGRLNADRTLSGSTPPRSVAVITGEDLPAIGASGLARFFILDMDRGDIPLGKELTELQEKARRGWLQRAMRGYILWLMKQADELPGRLHDLFLKYRENVREADGGQHDRAPETVACILIGYAMMLNYMRDLGLFDTEEAGRMLTDARTKLMEVSRRQAEAMKRERPTQIFLDSLGELMRSRQVALKDLTIPDPKDPPPTERMIGYMDAEYYYLLPGVAFGAVQRMCREQGTEFPVSASALFKHLRTDGVVKAGGDGKTTRMKRVDGKNARLLWIPAEVINGPRAEQEQQRMELQTVSNDDIPEDWKN